VIGLLYRFQSPVDIVGIVIMNGGVKEGDTVVVLGCGPVGLLTQKWAYFKGAEKYVEPILKLIKEEKFDPTDIITHELSIDRGEFAYEVFDEKKDDCIKVILKP